MNHKSGCVRCAYDQEGYCKVRRKFVSDDGRKCGSYITTAKLKHRMKRRQNAGR